MKRIASAIWSRLKVPILWRRRHLYDFPLTGEIPQIEPRLQITWVVKEHPDWPRGRDGEDSIMLYAVRDGIEVYHAEVLTNFGYVRRLFPACDLGERPIYFCDAVTHPDYRGNLLHPAAMTFAYRHYRQRGYDRAFIRVGIDNKASKSGIERAGYRLCAVAHHVTLFGISLKPFGRRLRNRTGRKGVAAASATVGVLCLILLSFARPAASQGVPSQNLPGPVEAPEAPGAPAVDGFDYFSRDFRADQLLANVERYHLGEDSFWRAYRTHAFRIAEGELRFALKYFPNHPQALYLMEFVSSGLGNPSIAIRAYERAIQLHPQHPYTQAQYGAFLVRIGATTAGIQQLRGAIAADSTLYQARAWLARALRPGSTGAGPATPLESQGSRVEDTSDSR